MRYVRPCKLSSAKDIWGELWVSLVLLEKSSFSYTRDSVQSFCESVDSAPATRQQLWLSSDIAGCQGVPRVDFVRCKSVGMLKQLFCSHK